MLVTSRLALTLDGLQVSTSPKALPALLAHLVSKTLICSPHTHLLRKAGADLVLPDHPDRGGFLWDTRPKDGFHPLVRASRLTDLVPGTTILFLRAYQSVHRAHKDPRGENRPAPIGPGADKHNNRQAPVEMPSEPNVHSQAPPQPATAAAPTPPVASKPSAEEVKVTAAYLETQNPGAPSNEARPIPTGPKGLTKITPAVPLPAALTAKAAQSMAAAGANPNNGNANPAASAAALKDATEAAKAAVAVAMAKLGGTSGSAAQPANGVDNLTRKVDEMRINAARAGTQAHRGRGRGGPRHAKVEVPDSDYDFEGANAKFNKEDMVKERIAGSPITEDPQDLDGEVEKAASGEPKQAYNKVISFFDNISSEAKDRKDNNGHKPGGREWRGEEQRRNMETFGQGSVDGGYRGYRGRGRGRGGMRGRGFGGRGRGAYRGARNDAQPIPQ
ncbi:hypothetical protein VSDG_04148 [Cytospora chrysosperma]|uniref:DFDF domain-containing protein n=1 Tax=Cytospora chrysosperma TaxID=252740 RepID=A0A423W0X1_CYTCH|nr:hypothetical protein VSDG_04148 [Valsa sordida]